MSVRASLLVCTLPGLTLVVAMPARAQSFDLAWHTIDAGGVSAGGGLAVSGAIGQPDAGTLSGGVFTLSGGFWQGGGAAPCYANCDNSTTPPILNVNDFACFLSRSAAAQAYANCDDSTTPPILNVNDFTCFLSRFAQGCP